MPRIVVYLLKAGSSTPLETTTDRDGRYELRDVDAGAYALSAHPDLHRRTYLPQRYGAEEPGIADEDRARPNLELKAGDVRTGLDIALWRGLGIEGRVLDPWETGMANVGIKVKRVQGRIHAVAHATTDDRGMYRAYGLSPGRYRVCAEVDQQADVGVDTTRLGTTCYPASVDETGAGHVVLTSEDATGIDIRVQPFRTYTLSGRVVDANGSPVTGAFVGAYPIDDRGPSASGNTRRGEFVLPGLLPGRYVVQASLGVRPPDDPDEDREAQVGYAFADIAAGDAGGVLVSLSKAVDVIGTVSFEGGPPSRRPGMVVQTGPVPFRSAMISTRPPFSPVDEDLSFKLTGVYRLPLIVHVTGLPDGWVLKSVQYGGRDVTYVPTDFGGPENARLQIVVTNRIAQASVRVLDDKAQPISSASVVAVPADPARWVLPTAIIAAHRPEGGLMKLGPLLPGDYLVAALSHDDAGLLFSEPAQVEALAALATRVRLVEGDAPTLELRVVSLPAR